MKSGDWRVSMAVEWVGALLMACGAWSCTSGASKQASRCDVEPADEAGLEQLAAWAERPTFRAGKYVHVTSTDREAMVFPPPAPGNRDYNNYVCA